MATFSFVTSAYRTEPYVADTIDSVLAQTCDDWELIVVDNGRSDGIARVVQPYTADPRIRLIRQENRGVSGGVEAGVSNSTGRYLCPLHSDDQVAPTFVARMSTILTEQPEIHALGVDAVLFSGADGSVKRETFRQLSWNPPRPRETAHRVTMSEVLSGRQPYYTGAFRRTAWDSVGGYQLGVERVHDMSLWLRLLAADHFVWYSPEPLGRYRVMAASQSRGRGVTESIDNTIEMLRRFGGKSDNERDRAAVALSVRRLNHMQSTNHARWALLDGDDAAARDHAARAFSLNPTLRGGLVLAGLTVAPHLVRKVAPARTRAGAALGRLRRQE